ncbi:hypothetical protein ACJJTC_008935 [Scirpophaga incertulas]
MQHRQTRAVSQYREIAAAAPPASAQPYEPSCCKYIGPSKAYRAGAREDFILVFGLPRSRFVAPAPSRHDAIAVGDNCRHAAATSGANYSTDEASALDLLSPFHS